MTIDHHMQEAADTGTTLSCEELVAELADGLCNRCLGEEPSLKILEMSVSISPEPFEAWIGATWLP